MKWHAGVLGFSTLAITLAQAFLFWPGAPAWSALGLWALGAFLLERSTRTLPGWDWGRFSLQLPWVLVALGELTAPSLWPLLCLWLLLVLLNSRMGRLELLADLWAALWLAPGLWLTRGLPTGLSWPLVSLAVLATQTYALRKLARGRAGRATWLRLELNLVAQRWAAWWVASAALWVSGPPFLKLLWLPGLLGLAWGAQNAAYRLQAESFERLQAELGRALRQQQALQISAGWLEKLHQLGLALESAAHPALMLGALQRYFPARSLALFGPDQRPLAVLSPQAEVLENLWQWGGHQELTGGGRLLSQAWLADEPRALLLPCGAGWLYVGQERGQWSEQDFAHLSPAVQRLGYRLQEWLHREGVGRQLSQSDQHSAQLQQTIDSQQFLLYCAERLLQPLELQPLWSELDHCLSQVLSLQVLAWVQAGELRAHRGQPLGAELPNWLQSLGSATAYLAAADRERWPAALTAMKLDNLVVLPLGAQGQLLVGFAGVVPLQPQQLRALQGLGHLFGGAAQRLALQGQLEVSRQLWLNSQKSLGQAQLAAGLAHELNSPLAAVQLALEASLLRQPQERLKTALDACQRARGILERLQEVTREHQQQETHQDVVQVLRALVEQLPRQPQPLGWKGPDSLLIRGSRALLEQALLPVLTNALEAGGGMELGWGRREDGQAWVRVADGGSGIPLEIRSRLGQFFFTTKALGTHLGLGLASLDQACRQLGARWEVESPPRGASLLLTFPPPS